VNVMRAITVNWECNAFRLPDYSGDNFVKIQLQLPLKNPNWKGFSD
jgi:hypothetical protein